MANDAISTVATTNTFDEWRVATNVLVGDRNILRNDPYVKDNSDFIIANGAMRLSRTTGGTLLRLEGTANAYIGGNVEANNIVVTNTITTTNLVVTGDQIITGSILTDANAVILRSTATGAGDGLLRIRQDNTTTNAELKFNSAAAVWQVSPTGTNFTTLLTVGNISSSITTTDAANVGSLTAVKNAADIGKAAYGQANTAATGVGLGYDQANTARDQANTARGQANTARDQANTARSQANTAYDQANTVYGVANTAANTARISANGGSTLTQQQINFVNTSTIQVSVVSGGGAAAGNANVSFAVIGGGGSGAQGAQGIQGTSIQGAQGIQGTSIQGAQGIQGTSIQGAQGIQGITGPVGAQYLHNMTSGYTTSGNVYVSSTEPTSVTFYQGDIWLQI